jgi:transcriptional regulator with XRE-family HTH domain
MLEVRLHWQLSLAQGRIVNTLQQLIRDRMADRGWSYGDVARRGDLPRSTVHHLATHDRLVRPPHPDTLAGLARGLDVPLDTVRTAAANAAGLLIWPEAVNHPEVDVLVASLNRLTAEDRRHVQALVDSLLHGYPEDEATKKGANSPGQRGS